MKFNSCEFTTHASQLQSMNSNIFLKSNSCIFKILSNLYNHCQLLLARSNKRKETGSKYNVNVIWKIQLNSYK